MRLSNKRGDHTGVGSFVQIVIVVLLFILAVSVSSKLLGSDKQDSMGSFRALADNIEIMLAKPTAFEYQFMTIFVTEESFISGFMDRSTFSSYSGIFPDGVRYIYPDECQQRSCICLYDLYERFPDNPDACRAFDQTIIFHTYNPKGTLIRASRSWSLGVFTKAYVLRDQNPSLYQDYPEELRMDFTDLLLGRGESSVAYQLYIEKFVENNNIHFFITGSLDNDQIAERIAYLSVCPEGSDPDCVGKRQDTRIGGDSFCYYSALEKRCILKNDINDCPLNVKLTQSCSCGSELYDVRALIGNYYCNQRSDGKLSLERFNCNDLPDSGSVSDRCTLYCKTNTETNLDCDPEELKSCTTDPCNLG
ncbi:hypothetical protein JXB28_00805, partial [Candidatus Woesearchaeota archaeon]|nr:hypothetical protein [Candidatus Woesearchaeota archaeon]